MKQKIIMHTQISLDGRIKGFDNPEVYYQERFVRSLPLQIRQICRMMSVFIRHYE